ncbi:DNA ligase 4 [Crepidotus variabilis]|uniref:DNA ligase n=1 Tax=Crepidotus variabilis TaxID=179855 RepID=A0A9P6E9W6_9AGAR|nr:DNA ligase 4 [Crepidotus variabilis]
MMQPTPAPSSAPNSPKNKDKHLLDNPSYPTPPQNVGSAPFGILVGLFEKLQVERKQDRRRKLIDAWFTHWRKEKGHDLYPVLRLILPQKDRERAVYGLKEKNLAKTYIKLIPLGMRDPDAIRLLNWKKPTDREKTSGDFPTVLCEVVGKRSSVIEGTLTVDDLNDILDELAKNMGKQDVQSKILQRVYNRSTAEEQRWIVRIILKDMNISVKETTVFSVFHPDAQDLFNTCSDLKKVTWELWDTSYRLNAEDKAVQLFHSFAPMLCKRPTKKIEDTVKEMGGSEFIIEEKLDGERMQVHKRGNEYFYCSRKGKDYTYLYGKHVGTGSLTPFIDAAFDSRIDDIILDGEMLVWDPISERNLPFGTLKTAALDKSKKEHNPRPCFKVFDLLYLNGQSLIHRSTSFRKKNLRQCLKEVQGRIEFTVDYQGKTAKDIRERMDDVMAQRGEGLVIKHPLSKYVLNGRNMDWIKVKPEYMDNLGETVDVMVVAGNYGSGKRGGGVSTLICAVFDDRKTYEDDEDPKYNTFVRIGSGLSFADYVWVRDKPWKVWDPKHPPDFLQVASRGQDDKGDVYLKPEDSFILKVKAAEITPSDQYYMGYTMRFPRALQIRDDLTIADCMSASAVLESLRSEKKRKMETDAGVTKKKRKVTTKKATVLPQYKGVSKKGVKVESDIFEGMKFVVMSDPKSRTGDDDKISLTQLIYANGGSVAQVATSQPELFVIYGGSVTPYDLKLVIDKDVIDVLKPSWIINSADRGEKLEMTSKYFFHATTARQTTDEYEQDAENEQDEEENMADGPGPAERDHGDKNEDEDMAPPKGEREITPKIEELDLDPELAEWFKVDDSKQASRGSHEDHPIEVGDDSVTEPDSDNEDVKEPEEVDLEDWFQVKASIAEGTASGTETMKSELSEKKAGKQPEREVGFYHFLLGQALVLAPGERIANNFVDVLHVDDDVRMGETDDAMNYDQEVIFKHLCFYLDTQENAMKHGMNVKLQKHEKDIKASFIEVGKMITDNGGRVGGLDEPKLTHVVLDRRDDSRRLELIKRTSKPKRRHLVISEYIQACLDEGTLLDEDEFAP